MNEARRFNLWIGGKIIFRSMFLVIFNRGKLLYLSYRSCII